MIDLEYVSPGEREKQKFIENDSATARKQSKSRKKEQKCEKKENKEKKEQKIQEIKEKNQPVEQNEKQRRLIYKGKKSCKSPEKP